MTMKGGDSYAVFPKKLAGYSAVTKEITGIMPYKNKTVTMLMTTNSKPGVQLTADELNDYGTPLGVADSILGGGEAIE
jgi:hypothetical protein